MKHIWPEHELTDHFTLSNDELQLLSNKPAPSRIGYAVLGPLTRSLLSAMIVMFSCQNYTVVKSGSTRSRSSKINSTCPLSEDWYSLVTDSAICVAYGSIG